MFIAQGIFTQLRCLQVRLGSARLRPSAPNFKCHRSALGYVQGLADSGLQTQMMDVTASLFMIRPAEIVAQ